MRERPVTRSRSKSPSGKSTRSEKGADSATSSRSRSKSPSSKKKKKKEKPQLGSFFIWDGTWLGSTWAPSQASLRHRQQRDLKNNIFDMASFALFFVGAACSKPVEVAPSISGLRMTVLVVNAIVAYLMRLSGNNVMPPVDKKTNPVIFDILNPIGSSAFLTYQSTTLFALYATIKAGAELTLSLLPYVFLEGSAAAAIASDFLLRVVALLCWMSPFFQGLAVVLTLLWLKFNWFETEWQETVIKFWSDLGFTSVAAVQWFGHATMPLAFVDIFLCRSYSRKEMTSLVMPQPTLVLFVAAYSVIYMGNTLWLATINGGHYPYPFLTKICEKWWTISVFTGGITTIVTTICVSLRLLSIAH